MIKKVKEEAAADDILFQEINEELKQEKMRNFWKKYGILATVVVIAALTFAVSFESIKAWQNKKAQTWSDAYAYAYNLQIQGKYDESIAVFKDIEQQNGGIYRDIAQMQIANVLLEQAKNDEALTVLTALVNNPDANASIQNMAVFKLASYKLDNAPHEEVEALLNRLIIDNGSWVNVAKEMKAMLEIREGNLSQALEIYNDILNNNELSDTLKSRVQDMISVLTEAQANS